eukprot:2174132-Rhodomonas_salina.1
MSSLHNFEEFSHSFQSHPTLLSLSLSLSLVLPFFEAALSFADAMLQFTGAMLTFMEAKVQAVQEELKKLPPCKEL